MTEKQKAKELVERYTFVKFSKGKTLLSMALTKENAKQCALICVDEILEIGVFWNSSEMVKDYPKNYELTSTYEYWEQVKQEIEKL